MRAATSEVSSRLGRHLLTALFGALFALALYQVWDLDHRWFLVAIAAICLAAGTVVVTPVFSELLLTAMFFSISLASFTKWLLTSNLRQDDLGNYVYSGMIGFGLIDGMFVGLYLSWLFRIFILREERLPRLIGPDFIVAWLVLAHLVSIPGSISPFLGIHSTVYLLRFVAVYFYISRHVTSRHLPWIVAALCFTVVVEGSIGIIQHTTGKLLGLALDKGAGGDELEYQYIVPGIEQYARATGTCYDSHSLGLYLAMLAPFPLVLWLAPPKGQFRLSVRLLFAAISALATLALVFTFSRSAWLAFAVAVPIGVAVMLMVWGEKQVIVWCGVVFLVAVLASPVILDYIIDKLRSPGEILTVRFEQYAAAWRVWKMNLLFGMGAGNWMEEARIYAPYVKVLPVHNTLLYIGVEMGIFGVVGFYGTVLLAMRRLWRVVRTASDTLESRIALASWIALAAYVVEGVGTPMFRELNPFLLFWIIIGLSAVLPRLHENSVARQKPVAS